MAQIALVIPCYKVREHILEVLDAVPPVVQRIFVIDDACPQNTGDLVESSCRDSRVSVHTNSRNSGVGAATMVGYREALNWGAQIIVKIDGDGQMNLSFIDRFLELIESGKADYVKGNRFFNVEDLNSMPKLRLLGNGLLSFVNKAVSGYWNVMDPTNGFTAISRHMLEQIPLEKIDSRYFFESDMLFRLGLCRAVVAEVAMPAVYAGAPSSLNLPLTCIQFPKMYMARFAKRIFYTYFLRDFSICSLQIVAGVIFLFFGITFGLWHWVSSISSGVPATSGTVMLAAMPTLLGVQFLLSAIAYDISRIPKK